MTIAVHITFEALPGKGDQLEAVLLEIVADVMSLEDSTGCDLMRSVDNPLKFTLVEWWPSIEAHKRVHDEHLIDAELPLRLEPLLDGGLAGLATRIGYQSAIARRIK